MRYLALILALATILGQAADTCPKGEAQWIKWGRLAVDRIFANAFDSEVLADIQDLLLECDTSLAAAPKAKACFTNLDRFSRAGWQEELPGHSLGLSMSDHDYYANVDYPEMMELPDELNEQAFLRLLDDNSPKAIDDALAHVANVNKKITDPKMRWRTFTYVSQHLPPPDGSGALGRFFVWVPGHDFDRYLQFGLKNDPKQKMPNGLSVVSIQKTDVNTKAPLSVPQARLKDFWRVRDKSGNVIVSTRLKEAGSMENCYQCHKQSLLPITPNPALFDAKRFGAALRETNDAMSEVGRIDFVGIDQGGYGPPLGPVKWPTRDEKFIRSCSNGKVVDPLRVKKVLGAMQCSSCHDGDLRGALNFPSILKKQPVGKISLVQYYVMNHKRMPPTAPDLTTDERQALVACLKQEYYGAYNGTPGVLRQWLLPASCPN